MYAFLIVFIVHFIGSEGMEEHSFNIWSPQAFDRDTCVAKAKETADYAAYMTAAKIPGC